MAEAKDYSSSIIKTITTTILIGQTRTDAINLSGATLKTIIVPDLFVATQLRFSISDDNITYHDYYNINDEELTVTITQGRAYGLAAIDFYSVEWLKITTNSPAAADREIKLIVRSI